MRAERNLKLDLFALGLLAFVAFLSLSLFTYDPADPAPKLIAPLNRLYPVDQPVYPPHLACHNACGRWGHLAADLLFHTFGWGAYFIVLSLAGLDVHLLRRRDVTHPWVRGFGWGLALVGVTTFAALLLPTSSPGPVIGAGGYLGATGRGLLEINFATAGAFILTVSLILAGLLLCTDFLVLHLLGWAAGGAAASLVGVSRGKTGRSDLLEANRATKAKPAKKAALAAVPEEPDEELEEAASPVKIRGKKPAAATADEDDADTEEEAEDEAEEPSTISIKSRTADKKGPADTTAVTVAVAAPAEASSLSQRLASALRIKNLGKKEDRDEVMDELDAASRGEDLREYELPPLDLLLPGETIAHDEHEKEVRQKAKMLEKTFANFGFQVKVVEIETGPVIAQYEVELEAGLRLSKITSLADDLAIALRVPSVRIVAPIPGKNTVGIEVPNSVRNIVRMREVIEETGPRAKKMQIPIFLGKDVSGNPLMVDLTSLPHLLIAGRTGTGKSVCLNSIIVSMLMSRGPDDVKMLMIDPKMVELSPYKKLPHLMHPVVTDMRKAEAILAWAVEKMEERYALLARAGVRHISVYNQLGEDELMERLQPENDEQRQEIPLHLPYIVIVADEIADLMMTAAKEVEQHIIRLAQKSRAVGIHLVLATQKPTVDVITGLIKSNLPARIAFQVASRVDSRVVLDEMGADKLLGNGDMLFLWPGTSSLLRGQGTYLSDDEINRVVDYAGMHEQQFVKELVQLKPKDAEGDGKKKLPHRDDLYEAAVDVVIREGRGSVSLLQRALGIGYGRAARLIDFMAEDGIVGDYKGSQAREVVITLEEWAAMTGQEVSPEEVKAPAAKKNKILPLKAEPDAAERADADHADADQDEAEPDDLEPEDFEQAHKPAARSGNRLSIRRSDEAEAEEDIEDELAADADEEADDDADLGDDEESAGADEDEAIEEYDNDSDADDGDSDEDDSDSGDSNEDDSGDALAAEADDEAADSAAEWSDPAEEEEEIELVEAPRRRRARR
ncbi:MAG TPA: DNA translocase FtsK 4TM domain-containing protein [Pirellulales bacterium]|jgi:S-DNA-T family DNA segregation ATPase FtsK/SpoIIIE|nr:DNA translocase FtsK 4TM domain-containing protein [Pirellulales bacterium]